MNFQELVRFSTMSTLGPKHTLHSLTNNVWHWTSSQLSFYWTNKFHLQNISNDHSFYGGLKIFSQFSLCWKWCHKWEKYAICVNYNMYCVIHMYINGSSWFSWLFLWHLIIIIVWWIVKSVQSKNRKRNIEMFLHFQGYFCLATDYLHNLVKLKFWAEFLSKIKLTLISKKTFLVSLWFREW